MLKTRFGNVLEQIANGTVEVAVIGGVEFSGYESDALVKFSECADCKDARTLRHIMEKPIRHLRIGDLVFVSMLAAELTIDMKDIKEDIIGQAVVLE